MCLGWEGRTLQKPKGPTETGKLRSCTRHQKRLLSGLDLLVNIISVIGHDVKTGLCAAAATAVSFAGEMSVCRLHTTPAPAGAVYRGAVATIRSSPLLTASQAHEFKRRSVARRAMFLVPACALLPLPDARTSCCELCLCQFGSSAKILVCPSRPRPLPCRISAFTPSKRWTR
jgi:hypothetical protein